MNSEDCETCPYDKAHRILKSRMQNHLVICKAAHPDVELVHCIYNTTHLLPASEIGGHSMICQDRIKLDSHIYIPEDCVRDKYPINNVSVLTEEDDTWDDLNVPTYNPKEYCSSNLIIRRLDCASGRDRKQFRKEERRRFSHLIGEGKEYPIQEKVAPIASRQPTKEPLCLAKRFDPKLIIEKMKKIVLDEENANCMRENKNGDVSIRRKKEEFLGKGRGRRSDPN